jgi:hypothetical protein
MEQWNINSANPCLRVCKEVFFDETFSKSFKVVDMNIGISTQQIHTSELVRRYLSLMKLFLKVSRW